MAQTGNSSTSDGKTIGCLGMKFAVFITVILVVVGILLAAKYALLAAVWLVLLAGIIYLCRRLLKKTKGRSIMEKNEIDAMDDETFERTIIRILQKGGCRNVYATKPVDNNDLNITGYKNG